MKTSNRFAAATIAAIVALMGCGPVTGNGTTVAPNHAEGSRQAPDPVGPHEGETAGELRVQLQRYVDAQRDLLPQSASDANACENVCSLATSICGVQKKLCAIADDHSGEEEYRRLCREARLECNDAQKACVSCVERNGDTGATKAAVEPPAAKEVAPPPPTPEDQQP